MRLGVAESSARGSRGTISSSPAPGAASRRRKHGLNADRAMPRRMRARPRDRAKSMNAAPVASPDGARLTISSRGAGQRGRRRRRRSAGGSAVHHLAGGAPPRSTPSTQRRWGPSRTLTPSIPEWVHERPSVDDSRPTRARNSHVSERPRKSRRSSRRCSPRRESRAR